VRSYEPKPEVCDDIDNDCSGEVDDGHPTQMGNPPPKYAAELKDESYPTSLLPGKSGAAWAGFVNRGTMSWKRGELWLTTQSAMKGEPSAFYDQDTWASWDVAAVLTADVLPGEIAYFQWDLRMPDDATGNVTDSFVLTLPPDVPIRCPVSDIALTVRTKATSAEQPLADEAPKPSDPSGCTCSASRRAPLPAAWLAITGLALAAGLRRRLRRQAS
jgi:hypothetical protein